MYIFNTNKLIAYRSNNATKIEDAIKDFKKGKMVILVDDADRNE